MVVYCIVCLLWLWVIGVGTVVDCCFVVWYNVCLLLLHLLFICCFGWVLFGDLIVCVVWVGWLVLGLFAMGLGFEVGGYCVVTIADFGYRFGVVVVVAMVGLCGWFGV